MTELLRTAPDAAAGSSRRAFARTAAAVASSGLLVGMGAVAAGPAMAATATDCDGTNTLTSPTDNATDIQDMLDANEPLVCLSGTFTLAGPLTFNHNVTFFGLTNGGFDGAGSQILNGIDGAELTIQNLAFMNGSAIEGGAVYIDGALVVENSTFTSNTSAEDGGAIFVAGISGSPVVEITDSTFTSNSTGTGPDGYSGGAIFVSDAGSFVIGGSTFTSNSADEFGGAVYGFSPLVFESTFTSNTAALGGGGLYAFATAVFESTFVGNEAALGGGVFGGAYAASFGSTFDDNAAEAVGGGIASYGELEILNSTFVDNTAGDIGGAVVGDYGRVGLSTFLNNEAGDTDIEDQSDSLYLDGDGGLSEVAGNIFAGSRSNAHLGSGSAGTYVDLGGNVFSTPEATEIALGTPAASTKFSQSVSSLFGPGAGLADNGGLTETVALIAGSPAIDAVPAFEFSPVLASAAAELQASAELQAVVDTNDVDQRDVERTGLADAGAYEYGDAELAATGAEPATTGWLVSLAALLLGSGAAVALGGRRRAVATTSARS